MQDTPQIVKSSIDWFCLEEILEVLEPRAFDLISDFSMTSYGLAFIKNEIILNKRRNILEFGSGLSTIFMALLVKKFSLDVKIISIESNNDWLNIIKEKLDLLKLSLIVELVLAPLAKNEKFGSSPWYDETTLNNKICKEKFDMVVVDGPPAYSPEIYKSRFGAAPFLQGRLKENYVIILDDANREGEREVISMWN